MTSALYVIPTLGRRPDYLGQALESIERQTFPNVAVAVVGPADEGPLRELCRQRDIPFVVQSGPGMSRAINDGWRAHGYRHDLWAWLGDDDELARDGAAHAVDELVRHPKASMVYGQCDYIDADGRTLFRARPSALAGSLLRWGPDLIPQPGSLARAEAVRRAGFVDESLRYAMDLDLFLRLKEQGRILYTPHVLARFRWHEDSTTVSAPSESDAEARLVRRRYWVGRRRVGIVLERPAMLAGRILHRAHRRTVH